MLLLALLLLLLLLGHCAGTRAGVAGAIWSVGCRAVVCSLVSGALVFLRVGLRLRAIVLGRVGVVNAKLQYSGLALMGKLFFTQHWAMLSRLRLASKDRTLNFVHKMAIMRVWVSMVDTEFSLLAFKGACVRTGLLTVL